MAGKGENGRHAALEGSICKSVRRVESSKKEHDQGSLRAMYWITCRRMKKR